MIEMLHQRWLHSHEEDTDSELVYRPATFRFPPSRGRDGFEFKSDFTCLEIGIGPTDAIQERLGSWEVEENDGIEICIHPKASEMQKIRVSSVDGERLVIKK